MRVHSQLVSDDAQRDVARNAEVGVIIFFDHEGVCYPGLGWNDFGFRLLGHWMHQINQVRIGSRRELELEFLDGDFRLSGSVGGSGIVELIPHNADEAFLWRLPWTDLDQAITSAANDLVAQARALGLAPRGINGVLSGLQRSGAVP